MRIREITIEGFKSFGEGNGKIPLEGVNILIGANGAGKSNFVSFIELLSALASDKLGYYVAENGFADPLMHFGVKNCESIEGKILFDEKNDQTEYSFSLNHGLNGELFIAREAISSKDKKVEFEVSGKRSILCDESVTADTELRNRIKGYLNSCRVYHFNDTSMTARIRQPGSSWDYKYLRADGGNLAAYLRHMKSEGELNKYYIRIVKMIREAFPRFGEFELGLPGIGTDPKISLTWYEKGSEEVFGPGAFSDGTLRFIALTTLLMQPKEYLPKLIVLDEPEIGLHPNAVKILTEMIRMASDHSQIIVATQSLELLNEFEPGEIVVTEYDDIRKTSIMKRLDLIALEHWLDDYSLGELWEKSVLGAMP